MTAETMIEPSRARRARKFLGNVVEIVPMPSRRKATALAMAGSMALGIVTLTGQTAEHDAGAGAKDTVVGSAKVIAGLACVFYHATNVGIREGRNPWNSMTNCAGANVSYGGLNEPSSVMTALASMLREKDGKPNFSSVDVGNGSDASEITVEASNDFQTTAGACPLDVRVVDSSIISTSKIKVNGKEIEVHTYHIDYSLTPDNGPKGLDHHNGTPNVALGLNLDAVQAAGVLNHSKLTSAMC